MATSWKQSSLLRFLLFSWSLINNCALTPPTAHKSMIHSHVSQPKWKSLSIGWIHVDLTVTYHKHILNACIWQLTIYQPSVKVLWVFCLGFFSFSIYKRAKCNSSDLKSYDTKLKQEFAVTLCLTSNPLTLSYASSEQPCLHDISRPSQISGFMTKTTAA